jgi:hypothetical protein
MCSFDARSEGQSGHSLIEGRVEAWKEHFEVRSEVLEGHPGRPPARGTRTIRMCSFDARSGRPPSGLAYRRVLRAPLIGELTPSAERRSLSLALESAAAHAPTNLAEVVLVPLSGNGNSCGTTIV